jgi:hypothetical protein
MTNDERRKAELNSIMKSVAPKAEPKKPAKRTKKKESK